MNDLHAYAEIFPAWSVQTVHAGTRLMSTPSDFDLELHFLPAWAKQPAQDNRYAKFEGVRERSDDRRDHRPDRPPRRPAPPAFGQGAPPAQGQPRRDGPRPPRRDDRGPRRDDRGRGPGRDQGRTFEPVTPLPEINIAFIPDENGVDSLARQIRTTGRAYPLFDIAQMILAKPERHTVTFAIKTKPDKSPLQPLHLCALDDSLWLSEDDAVRHLLEKHFTTFYQPEKTQIDAPKGVYTFVAQCGMSGAILGPPNYHDYQNQLRKLHAERFSRMPFDAFKARVKIVKDEAVVKKWVEDQSWRTEYICLNVPEPLKLATREEVEKHFRQVHLPNLVKTVETHRLSGAVSRNLRDRGLQRLLRQRWEEQKHFPIQIATSLSQQFAARGLQFFKVNRTVTHVAVARPSYLDLESTPVSDGVRRIVEFINSHPKCTHKQLLHALAPVPAPVTPPASSAAVPASGEGATPGAENAPATVPIATSVEPSPEMAAVMTDLHWLVHQGHVIEFANGVLETAKKPAPRPEKPAKKEPAAKPEATPPAEPPIEGEPGMNAAREPGAPSAEAVLGEAGLPPADLPSPVASEMAAPAETPPANPS
jgi:hypothetical protein